jgi:hypothetical protein
MKTESNTRKVLVGQTTLASIRVIESVTSFLQNDDGHLWLIDGEFDFDEVSNKPYVRVVASIRLEKGGYDCRKIWVEFFLEQRSGFSFGPNTGKIYWAPLVSSGLAISLPGLDPLMLHFYDCGSVVGGDGTVGFAKRAEKFKQVLFPV